MKYPSLLWQDGLDVEKKLFPVNESGRITPASGKISQETIEDLLPKKAFCDTSAAFFRHPCREEEIEVRQKLIWHLAHDAVALGRIEVLLDELGRFEQLLRRWSSPTIAEKAHVLLFPAVAGAFVTLAESFAGAFPAEIGYGQTVRECFAGLLQDMQNISLRQTLDGFFSHYPTGVRLEIGASPLVEGITGGHRETLRQIFAEMGIADAYPTVRAHMADSDTIEAYCTAYPDVLSHARRLLTTYEPLLRETYAMEDVLLYRLELIFLREVAAYTRHLEEMGYPLCLPKVAKERTIHLRALRDVSLAARELRGEEVVPNDVELANDCRFCYVTGANGGGKTTYLRSVGIAVLFYLAGCPVSAKDGEIWCFARLCTHFPSREDFTDSGRFVDEVRRADEIRAVADRDTVVLCNETFSGTDEEKSERYSRALAEDMVDCGAFGLYVTHIHSLTHGRIPTLAAVVDETDENRRTYRIRRMDGTDSSFAEDILKKYDLTEEGIARRLAMMQERRGERT